MGFDSWQESDTTTLRGKRKISYLRAGNNLTYIYGLKAKIKMKFKTTDARIN